MEPDLGLVVGTPVSYVGLHEFKSPAWYRCYDYGF
jgi:hypothetical protein